MSVYKELGIGIAPKKIKKIKPNGQDIGPIKHMTKVLNNLYYHPGGKNREETVWYAFMPWVDNADKKWYLLCTSLEPVFNVKTRNFVRAFKKRFPYVKFEVRYLHSMGIYFEAREHNGIYI